MVALLGGLLHIPANKYERLKFLFLTICFAFVLGSYTIAKELKDAMFVNIVGSEYLPTAKFLVIFLLIPAALGYSRLVDVFRRYQLLGFYSLLYGVILAVFAILLGHSTIGLANTDTSPYRLFGWLLYFVLEGYSPFVVGVFWAFANSVTNPQEAKNFYPIMVAGSKVGGIATALFAWYLLSNVSLLGSIGVVNQDVFAHQILMGVVSVMLLCVPVLLMMLMKVVPGRYLHGYEAVYQLEKKLSKTDKSETGVLPGLKLLLASPYVLGIFGLVFFYETLNVVLNFQRIFILKTAAKSMAGFTASMFWQRLQMHAISMVLCFVGVQPLLSRFGVRRCLLFVPMFISILLFYFVVTLSPDSIMYVFIGLGAINYSFSYPLREVLYIPTVKDMKFKAKAWIDTFGTKFSKGFGSLFAAISAGTMGAGGIMGVYSVFFMCLMSMWFAVAWLLGSRYEKAISNEEIIGK